MSKKRRNDDGIINRIETKLRMDDEVVKICGKDKGKHGKIIAMDLKNGRVVVKGINFRKINQRPTQENPKGGVLEVEQAMHISNVMFYDSKAKKGVRLGKRFLEDNKKVRFSKGSGKEV